MPATTAPLVVTAPPTSPNAEASHLDCHRRERHPRGGAVRGRPEELAHPTRRRPRGRQPHAAAPAPGSRPASRSHCCRTLYMSSRGGCSRPTTPAASRMSGEHSRRHSPGRIRRLVSNPVTPATTRFHSTSRRATVGRWRHVSDAQPSPSFPATCCHRPLTGKPAAFTHHGGSSRLRPLEPTAPRNPRPNDLAQGTSDSNFVAAEGKSHDLERKPALQGVGVLRHSRGSLSGRRVQRRAFCPSPGRAHCRVRDLPVQGRAHRVLALVALQSEGYGLHEPRQERSSNA